jgi:hypothetical protein
MLPVINAARDDDERAASESQIVRKPYPHPGKQDRNGLKAAL